MSSQRQILSFIYCRWQQGLKILKKETAKYLKLNKKKRVVSMMVLLEMHMNHPLKLVVLRL